MNKMIARLQAATSSARPVLLRVDYDAGHGGVGATRTQHVNLLTDQFSFLLWQLGDIDFQAEYPAQKSTKGILISKASCKICKLRMHVWSGDEMHAPFRMNSLDIPILMLCLEA
jgi:hypothetical protein